jgi:predicted dithiol-disulfide oxidoreductase (DUF899 family)
MPCFVCLLEDLEEGESRLIIYSVAGMKETTEECIADSDVKDELNKQLCDIDLGKK